MSKLAPLKFLYIFLGGASVALGVIGIFLPLLPTTPFLLLAAFFFSRSSEKYHRWLMEHPRLGPFLQAWNQHGVIGIGAKITCTVFMVLALAYPLLFQDFDEKLKWIAFLTGVSVLVFIWTRPSHPPTRSNQEKKIF